MAGDMNITLLQNDHLYSDRSGYKLLKKYFLAAGGLDDEFEGFEIVNSQLIAYVPIENTTVPEARFNQNYADPSIKFEEGDAFLVNRVGLGFMSVPNGEGISHNELLYYNSPLDFAYQAPGAVAQYKALESIYKLEFSLNNNAKQAEFHGENLKKVPEHSVRGQLHYPGGIWHHLSKQVLFKGTDKMIFKPESQPQVEITSFPGDKTTQKMYAGYRAGGLLIRGGAQSLLPLFKSLEKNNCLPSS